MRIKLLAMLAVAATLAPLSSRAVVGEPYVEGPDVPTVTGPAKVVEVIKDGRWSCSESLVTRTMTVPMASDGEWDRIIIEVDALPDGDPWDRLLTVAVNGAEVLRGTTPRTAMTLRKDITGYRALLPQGTEIPVSMSIGSYVGAINGKVRIEFYDDEPTAALVDAPAAHVVAPFYLRRLTGNAKTISTTATFPTVPPARARIDFTTSGHGNEEFWYQNGAAPRAFHILVDEVEVGTVFAMPYVYALAGFGNGNANTACVGPGTSPDGDLLHPIMWWTAQRVLDLLGVHTGDGEIPQYRIEVVDPALLARLSGQRTVTIRQERGGQVWITSLSFLLD